MAQQAATKEYNTFIGGLVTEASPLTYPENAALDLDNLNLLRDGSLRRRLGMDYESGNSLISLDVIPTFSLGTVVWTNGTTTNLEDKVVQTFVWENAGNNGNRNFLVLRVAAAIYIYDIEAEPISGTAYKYRTSIIGDGNPDGLALNDALLYFTAAAAGINEVQFSVVAGQLVWCPAFTGQPVVCFTEYDSSGESFSTSSKTLQVRDFWGVNDGLADEERPTSLTQTHTYNLYNQGWPISVADGGEIVKFSGFGAESSDSTNLLDDVFTNLGAYPSNSDSFLANVQSLTTDSHEAFTINNMQVDFPLSLVSKGRIIINPFDRGTSRQGKFPLLTNLKDDDTSGATLKATASYAGRAWYAVSNNTSSITDGDSKSPSLGGYIFYTQILTSIPDKINKCFQKNDPTSEIPDVLDDDGGYLIIPEARNIVKLVEFGQYLLVFATNGVWAIRGGDTGFTPLNYTIEKVSTVGAIGGESIVQAESAVFYWADPGIYAVGVANTGLGMQVLNIAESTVQTRYLSYTTLAKEGAKVVYDEKARQVEWWFNPNTDENSNNKLTNVLIFDLVLQAFYTYTIGELDTDSPIIVAPIALTGYSATTETLPVIDNIVDTVIDGANNVIDGTFLNRANSESSVKYLTIVPSSSSNDTITISQFNNTSFLDWEGKDGVGVDAPAYIETGYEILGDSQRRKQAPYLTLHMERTETGFVDDGLGNLSAVSPSSCKFRAKWGWSDSSSSGRWSDQYEGYRLNRLYIPSSASDTFDYGFKVVTTKNKIRGYGRSLSLRFDSSSGKDMHLYGWGINFTGGDVV